MVRCSTCHMLHMRQFCWFFSSSARSDTVEFNRLPCPNDMKYDDVVFVDRLRYQLAMFGNRLLIGLSRFLPAHIAYDIDTAKIIAAFCRISYCLYDLKRLKSIACCFQTTRCTMMHFTLIHSVINWLCLGINYWYGYLDSFMFILHVK